MRFRNLLLLLCVAAGQGASIGLTTNQPALAHVRRIYVEQLGGGASSDQMQDMIIAALQNTGLFTITENRENADAILKGSGSEQIYTDVHDTSDALGVHASASTGSGSSVRFAQANSRQSGSVGVTQNESSKVSERRHDAVASLRLVAQDGDVIWSTVQESHGGKFRGAMADVADRVAERLKDEANKARLAVRKAAPLETPGQ